VEPVPEKEGLGDGRAGVAGARDRLWRCWDIRDAELARILEPSGQCVIDGTGYGTGSVTLKLPGGGTREYGVRPLWPDEAKQRDFHSFYSQLEASVAERGITVPILLWKIGGRFYVRYGASRCFVAKKLGLSTIPALVCTWDDEILPGKELHTPVEMLAALGVVRVGWFEASYDRLDFHRCEPHYFVGVS
jgi:hypothetical protein